MARNFWLGWWCLMFYMSLLGIMVVVVTVLVCIMPSLHSAPMYLFIGLVMYACDPRYWTMEYGHENPVHHEIRILVFWPVLYPYYFLYLLLVGISRWREE